MSECVQAAGVNVDDVLGQVLQARLANSRFGDKDNIKAMVEEFEKKTKRLFNGNTNKNVIKFGGSRDTDRNLGILKGQISLSKEEVLATFKPVSENIVNSIRRLISSKRPQVRYQGSRSIQLTLAFSIFFSLEASESHHIFDPNSLESSEVKALRSLPSSNQPRKRRLKEQWYGISGTWSRHESLVKPTGRM